MADDKGRQRARGADVGQRRGHPVLLVGERLAAGEGEVDGAGDERAEELGLLRLHFGEGPVGPVAGVGLHQSGVGDGGHAEPSGDDVGGLLRTGERAAPQGGEPAARRDLGQRARLLAAALGQRHGTLALEATLGVVGRLAVAGQPHAHSEGLASIVSERSPSRRVSRLSTSSGAMLPRLQSGPRRRTNHTC